MLNYDIYIFYGVHNQKKEAEILFWVNKRI